MYNKVTLIGRITKDPELKVSSNQKKFVRFSLAVDGRGKDEKGERTTSFIPCITWNEQAENLSKYIKKGFLICVDGYLNQRTIQKDGKNESIMDVTCDRVLFLESKKDQPQQTTSQLTSQVSDEELPF